MSYYADLSGVGLRVFASHGRKNVLIDFTFLSASVWIRIFSASHFSTEKAVTFSVQREIFESLLYTEKDHHLISVTSVVPGASPLLYQTGSSLNMIANHVDHGLAWTVFTLSDGNDQHAFPVGLHLLREATKKAYM